MWLDHTRRAAGDQIVDSPEHGGNKDQRQGKALLVEITHVGGSVKPCGVKGSNLAMIPGIQDEKKRQPKLPFEEF